MSDQLILDTCAVIWTALDMKISAEAENAINASASATIDVVVSPITAWELGMLASKRRLPAAQGPSALFDEYLARKGVVLGSFSPGILIDSSFLPGDFHSDPADRIIVATARAHNLTVVTRDREILRYAGAGYVRAIEC